MLDSNYTALQRQNTISIHHQWNWGRRLHWFDTPSLNIVEPNLFVTGELKVYEMQDFGHDVMCSCCVCLWTAVQWALNLFTKTWGALYWGERSPLGRRRRRRKKSQQHWMDYSAHTRKHTNRGRQCNSVATRADIQTHDTTQPEEGDNTTTARQTSAPQKHTSENTTSPNTYTHTN